MRFLKNRIIISFVIIVALVYLWEFQIKPVSGPLYTAAVTEYKGRNYQQSLNLLGQAYVIDPNDTAILTLFGWDYLKLGKPDKARPYFDRALVLNPQLVDTRLGSAFTWLELGEPTKALQEFQKLPPTAQKSLEARVAMARAYRELGENRRALELAVAVLRENSEDKLARKELVALTGSQDLSAALATPTAPISRPAQMVLAARLQNGYFEVPQGGTWKRFYVSGVNLSPAIPGHYPSDPPTESADYQKWLEQIAALGANCLRAYTILPPGFYDALLRYNSQHAASPLYVFQSIWIKDAPDGNLLDKGFTADFQNELRNAVDAIHGQASLPMRPGTIGGIYTGDVSPYVLGWLVGRDLEPHVVLATNRRNSDVKSFSGAYLTIEGGNPTEVWLTQRCDALLQYEVEKYNWQRPVAFVNTASLDPLTHPTESRMAEEFSIRRSLGEKELPPLSPNIDDDDAVSLDPTKLKPTATFLGGTFAAYSVYPYYPDFMGLDPRYLQGRDAQGPSSFQAYLEDLRRYHKDMPLLVTEFGIPSGLGISHLSPQGWDDGGHNEVQQGNYLARMIRSVADTGCAGGLIQSWMDEWFRSNWLVRDFEAPGNRTRLWLNDLSPDAQQGLMGFRTARAETYLLRGDAGSWQPPHLFYAKPPESPSVRDFGDRYDPARHLLRLYVDSDEAYLYLRLDVQKLDNNGDGKPDWDQVNYLITLGTTAEPTGSVLLPFVSNVRVPSGADFVIRLGKAEDSKILISSAYNPYNIVPVPGIPGQTQIRYRIPFLASLKQDAQFQEMTVEPNRRRYGRDGHMYPPVRYSRSELQWGTLERGSADYNTLAEWHANPQTNIIELRIPWGLLQVTDPSSLQVLAGIDRDGTFSTEATKGFLVGVVSYRPGTQELADVLPRFRSPGIIAEEDMKRYKRAPWDTVPATPYLKDSYYAVQRALQDLRSPRRVEPLRAAVQKGRRSP
ncbi:MAG: tetratricopeptide repeat protein [Acidobacteriia bacterium]|nr:tetratricopeptide repeat protein [Terriglobia bacterium]